MTLQEWIGKLPSDIQEKLAPAIFQWELQTDYPTLSSVLLWGTAWACADDIRTMYFTAKLAEAGDC